MVAVQNSTASDVTPPSSGGPSPAARLSAQGIGQAALVATGLGVVLASAGGGLAGWAYAPHFQDTDGDRINNADDGCADDKEDKDGFEDQDGCPDPDNDGDGIRDADDRWPDDQGGRLDTDHDGVLDSFDSCAKEPGPPENKGCPDNDQDRDGLVDRIDNCPVEPGPPENSGCPLEKKQLVVMTDQKLEIKERVFFQSGSDVIEMKSFALLNNIAAVLNAHPEIKKIRVEGYTDNVGSPELNAVLSGKRAASVKKYLVEVNGIADARLDSIGYGMQNPIASNDTEEGRAKNRRVEFVIADETAPAK
ncbi:MAG: hypothetical protein A2138_12220 [Deltaproteobacteria bacterium RBG_16_71_12]|nr:MAG: hypothetical protein A2138_12220 [Deltaproteobacteria bacterium RBG_16_71_12]